jgi:hypothetical protein
MWTAQGDDEPRRARERASEKGRGEQETLLASRSAQDVLLPDR